MSDLIPPRADPILRSAQPIVISSTVIRNKLFTRWIHASLAAIRENARLLTALDQAVGDGDHGDNMLRGFTKLVAKADELELCTFDDALQIAGTTLVMSIGGASGPLFGSFFLGMGRALAKTSSPDIGYNEWELRLLADAFAGGVEAVKTRGKADLGEKTMLDVLIPVSTFLHIETHSKEPGQAFFKRLEVTAIVSMERTKCLQATKGRASFLKERSIGHLDPGAVTSYLLIRTLCETAVL